MNYSSCLMPLMVSIFHIVIEPHSSDLCYLSFKASGWGVSSDQNGSTWTPETNETDSFVKQEPDAYDHMHHDTGAIGTTIEGSDEEAAVWFMERVCVQLKRNDAHAIIKEINGSTALVELEDKSMVTVRNGEVSMVPPQEHDMVLEVRMLVWKESLCALMGQMLF